MFSTHLVSHHLDDLEGSQHFFFDNKDINVDFVSDQVKIHVWWGFKVKLKEFGFDFNL